MNWKEVQRQDQIFLNLGGGYNCHPKAGYESYISVDINPSGSCWIVKHDLRNAIPLPNGSVTRILAEDFIEHITLTEIKALLDECFRLLKKEGVMRISAPDYNNPKDRKYLYKKEDPRIPGHITFINYELMKQIIDGSLFSNYRFYHYWKKNEFIQEVIDYSVGMIKRTPDNDPRSRRKGIFRNLIGYLMDFRYIISCGFRVSKKELLTQKGHRLHVTSLVVDLFKGECK